MKTPKALAAVAGAVSLTFASAGQALAQSGLPLPSASIIIDSEDAGFRIQDFGKFIQGLLSMVLFIAALLVFAYLIWGGIQWITSGGDKGKTEEARNKITAAIIGLAVLAASYVIFIVAASFLGIGNPFAGEGFVIPKAYDTVD